MHTYVIIIILFYFLRSPAPCQALLDLLQVIHSTGLAGEVPGPSTLFFVSFLIVSGIHLGT